MVKRFFSTLIIIVSISFVTMGFRNIHGQVVCFGDSITHGALVNGYSWIYFLSGDHTDIDFVNAGRSGRKTSDKEELLPVLKQYPNADYYLIFLGVNDLKDGTDSMVNNCVDNMNWMIRQIRDVNTKAKILILAPSDINLKMMNEINVHKKYNENTKQSLYKLEKRYRQLAKDDHCEFLSLLHTVSKVNYVDGLHPNIKGQKEIEKIVWKGLNKLN